MSSAPLGPRRLPLCATSVIVVRMWRCIVVDGHYSENPNRFWVPGKRQSG